MDPRLPRQSEGAEVQGDFLIRSTAITLTAGRQRANFALTTGTYYISPMFNYDHRLSECSSGLGRSIVVVAIALVLAGCQTIQGPRSSVFLNSHPLRYCVVPNGNIYTVPITPQSRCATGDTEFPDRPAAENRAASIRAMAGSPQRAASPTSLEPSQRVFCVTRQGTTYVSTTGVSPSCASGDTGLESHDAAERLASEIWQGRRARNEVRSPLPSPFRYCVTPAGLVYALTSSPQAQCDPRDTQFFDRQGADTRAAAIRSPQPIPDSAPRIAGTAVEQPRPPQAAQAPPQTQSSPPTSTRPSISAPDAGRAPSRPPSGQTQEHQVPAPRASSPTPQVAQVPAPRAAPSPPRQRVSTGSSFGITSDGVIVTNHHVVEDCLRPNLAPEVLIDGEWLSARVLGFSQRDDLAVIRVNARGKLLPHLPRSGRPMRLGEPVYAFGYPLADLLAESGNFSQGMISAMAGLLNDPRHLQISVPVQQGNSGGPLVDETGAFVGIVTSKLNAVRVAQFTGDIPQNVNFAVKSSVLVNLLETIRVSIPTATTQMPQSPPEIAQRVSAATHKVRCRV